MLEVWKIFWSSWLQGVCFFTFAVSSPVNFVPELDALLSWAILSFRMPWQKLSTLGSFTSVAFWLLSGITSWRCCSDDTSLKPLNLELGASSGWFLPAISLHTFILDGSYFSAGFQVLLVHAGSLVLISPPWCTWAPWLHSFHWLSLFSALMEAAGPFQLAPSLLLHIGLCFYVWEINTGLLLLISRKGVI